MDLEEQEDLLGEMRICSSEEGAVEDGSDAEGDAGSDLDSGAAPASQSINLSDTADDGVSESESESESDNDKRACATFQSMYQRRRKWQEISLSVSIGMPQ